MAGVALSAATFGGAALFGDGQSDWSIVLSKEPSPTEAFAAEELQTNIFLIGGATLPIVKTDEVPTGGAVVIGGLGNPAVVAKADVLGLEKSEDDLLAMKTLDGNLYLAGNSPRAALFAVYHFLKVELGVRWFWQAEYGWDKIGRDDGTYRTKRVRYELPSLDWRYRPRFRYREMSQTRWHGHVPAERWMLRQGLNSGCQSGDKVSRDCFVPYARASHSIGLSSAQYEEHPDWFALLDGRRSPHGVAGCWSNPEFLKAMVERHVKASEGAVLLKAFVADVVQRCSCEACTKEPDRSSRFWNFYRELADEIRKVRPDLRYVGLAYQEYRPVPEHADCSWLEYVEYCQYNRCYIHKLGDADCPVNSKSLAEIGRWCERSRVSVYGYHFGIFDRTLFVPFWNMLAEEVRHYAKNPRIVRLKTETPIPRAKVYEDNIHVKFRIPYYIYAQMLWNPEQTADGILRDWCEHVYGAGAQPMFAYLTRFAAAWDGLNRHASYFGGSAANFAPELITPELVAFAKMRFDEAEDAVKKSGDARALKEIHVDRRHFDEWVRLWEVTNRDHVSYNLPHLPDAKSWQDVPRVDVRSESDAVLTNVDLRLCWTDEALRVRLLGVKSGAVLRLETGDGKVQQFPMADKKLAVPFAELTGTRPKDGDTWRLSVVGRTATGQCGYPSADATEMALMASVVFTEKCRGQRLAWICSPHSKDVRYQGMKDDLVRHGWNADCLRTLEEAEAADYSKYDLILYNSHKNKLSKECFRQKIVPAVKKGAVLFMNCYYGCGDFVQKFGDSTYGIDFAGGCASTRRRTWITPSSFAKVPNELLPTTTPPGVLILNHPESWEVLMKQARGPKGEELPYMVIRPCGKGAVLVTASLCGDLLPAMDNALEYGRKIAAEQ